MFSGTTLYGKIGLLIQPRVCEFSTAREPLSGGKTSTQSFHCILPSCASSTVDLIVDMNSQDFTQTAWKTSVSRGVLQHVILQSVPATRGFYQNEHTRIHWMLIETQVLGEELEGPPPLLGLIPQAISYPDFKDLFRVHAFFDVGRRHGNGEGPFGLSLPCQPAKRLL